MDILFYILSLALLIATFLPLSKNPKWWIRSLDFPRLQLLFVSALLALCMGLYLAVRPNQNILWLEVCIISCLVCAAYHLFWIIPYTSIWRVEVPKVKGSIDEARTFSIMTANVLTPNRNSDKLIELVTNNQPDVLVTLESDQWWEDQLQPLETDYPYTLKCPLDNLYGMHVYSKLELSDSEIKYIVEEDVPSMHTMVELRSGDMIRVHFLHPAPPSPTENEESTERDAELVLVADQVNDAHGPVLVTGDLNDVAWSNTTRLFRKISHLRDPRIGRGMFNTFHADYPLFRWPLDHLFHSQQFSLVNIKRLEAFGSDHFALYTQLYLRDEQDHQKPTNPIDTQQDDIKEAKEKVNSVRVSSLQLKMNRS